MTSSRFLHASLHMLLLSAIAEGRVDVWPRKKRGASMLQRLRGNDAGGRAVGGASWCYVALPGNSNDVAFREFRQCCAD